MERLKRRIRFLIWLAEGFLQKHSKTFLFAIILGFFFFFLAKPVIKAIFTKNGEQTQAIGIIGNFTPSALPQEIQTQISMGLTSITETGEATSAAAINWEATDSGKIYKFNLRNDLSWQDGKPFTSSDVNYNLKDVEIKPTSAREIEFILKEPFSPLPTILSQPLFKKNLIGLGSMRVSEIKYSGRFIQSISLKNRKETVVYKFYPSNDTLLSAYKMGEIKIAKNLTDVTGIVLDKRTRLEKHDELNRYVGLFFNTKEEPFSERNERLALAYATPNSFNGYLSATGPISQASWAFNSNVKRYSYNPEQSKKFMDKVKTATSSAQSATNSAEPREEIITLSALRPYLNTATEIKDAWEKLGFKVEIKLEDFTPSRFQVFLTGVETPDDPDQYAFWHSTQSTNLTGFASPKIDKLLEDSRKTIEKEKRLQKYLDFQKNIVDDCPAIFLYHPISYTLTRT